MTTQAPGIFNDVLGPVMRGPSSSHTAGSYHIAVLARGMLGAAPTSARLAFDPTGSYARVYREQGVDRAFALGLIGLPLTDERFFPALAEAAATGLSLAFVVEDLERPDHPNAVEMALAAGGGARLSLRAKSVGGGAVEITRVDGYPVRLTGEMPCLLVEAEPGGCEFVERLVRSDASVRELTRSRGRDGRELLVAWCTATPSPELVARLAGGEGVVSARVAPAIAYVKRGAPLFDSAAAMLAAAEREGWSLGKAALAYEAQLLGLDEQALAAEMARRLGIMRAAVAAGTSPSARPMQLLAPTARRVLDAERDGRVAIGGLHTRAAARAMAVMHVNGAMGVVCAAPTGGSAGVLPGVIETLIEERGLDERGAVRALFAASAVGLVVAMRATFAAEVAGCQVEIGAAGAMGAAAVVEAAGGSARQAADAAAIAFQNTMGSVCDLVQGMVEIPCHTRNAVAASSAFVCADLAMGGYVNPIGLDETIDAVYQVGLMMPSELRCTSRGGLAVTPSALKLHRRPPTR